MTKKRSAKKIYIPKKMGPFPASPNLPGQAQQRAAFDPFKSAYKDEGWYPAFLDLVDELGFGKAAYVAWKSSPAGNRNPPTQMEFAKAIGLTSDRIISEWRKDDPRIEALIKEWQIAPLFEHRADVINALIAVAQTPDPSAHPDRKMFLQLTKDLVDPVRNLSDEFILNRIAELERVSIAAGGSQTPQDPPAQSGQ